MERKLRPPTLDRFGRPARIQTVWAKITAEDYNALLKICEVNRRSLSFAAADAIHEYVERHAVKEGEATQ